MHKIGTSQETGIGVHLSHFGLAMILARYFQNFLYLTIQIVCIGSIAELEDLSGVKGITDLHRDSIDHITIPSKTGRGSLKRIDEVFDCWFESGRLVLTLLF